jgi:hypothetical protein
VRWLLFLPRLTSGSSARVRVWRSLQRLGALSLQGAVWVLPDQKPASKSLHWLAHELSDSGSGGVIARAEWVQGLTNAELTRQFRDAAATQWTGFIAEAKKAAPDRADRLAKRFEDLKTRDFFSVPEQADARRVLERLRAPMRSKRVVKQERYDKRIWITRRDIHVDRMASGWLIRRFIDPKATFRFVDLSRYQHRPGELRFDLDGAEFTHEGERCTFEVLQRRFCPKDSALKSIGELVHDLDFDDGKFGKPEVAGFGQQMAAIASTHDDDLARLDRASAMLDDLYDHRKRR